MKTMIDFTTLSAEQILALFNHADERFHAIEVATRILGEKIATIAMECPVPIAERLADTHEAWIAAMEGITEASNKEQTRIVGLPPSVAH